jgi:uncharacterized protein involved in cysteine biosynthesis
VTGVWDGLQALPRGLRLVLRTPGIKRWLVPPFLVTCLLLVVALGWVVARINGLIDEALPGDITIEGTWAWLEARPEGWDWLKTAWASGVVAVEWLVNTAWGLFTSQPLRWLGWFLVGSLVVWYCFSIAYEALAGPFLDEVQARIEARWFGLDPRSRLERPNDIPTSRCMALSGVALVVLALLLLLGWSRLGAWAIPLAIPLSLVPSALIDRRYGPWALWVASVEGRALWASLQATILTTLLLAISLPVYFVPGAGYFLFAMVTGFATAVGLLDIPFERRGWTLRQRGRFVGRNLLPFLVFGISAGFLLAIPLLGPLLMVPSASLGGLWLVCRLEKGSLR